MSPDSLAAYERGSGKPCPRVDLLMPNMAVVRIAESSVATVYQTFPQAAAELWEAVTGGMSIDERSRLSLRASMYLVEKENAAQESRKGGDPPPPALKSLKSSDEIGGGG